MTTAVRNDPLSFAPEFDTSLMALHPFPFAYYVEPEGWSELAAMRGPRKSHYQKFVPQTHRIAQAMYSHVHERRRWGKQLDGGWVTETFMSEVNAKWGKRLCDCIYTRDILKHLCGRSGFARGTSDVPFHREFAEPVSVLRFDVDQDWEWISRDPGPIWETLKRQRDLMAHLGLGYEVFRTGGRGVQLIIPLPCPTSHSVASVLVHLIRDVLVTAGGTDFKSNLDGILRLPGGVHARENSLRLGLFIDVENERLYGIEKQAELLARCWSFNQSKSRISSGDMSADMDRLRRLMDEMGIRGSSVVDQSLAYDLLDKGSDLNLITSIKTARDAAGVRTIVGGQKTLSTVRDNATVGGDAAPKRQGNGKAWAQRTMSRGFQPRGFWRWINYKGERGAAAAHILYGDDAEIKLIGMATETPCRCDLDLKQRFDTIKSMCKRERESRDRRRSRPSSCKSDVAAHTLQLAKQAVAEIPRGNRSRWNMELTEMLLALILTEIDRAGGEAPVSINSIQLQTEAQRPELQTNRQSIAEALTRLSQHGILARRSRVRAWGEADIWSCGPVINKMRGTQTLYP